MKDALKQSHDLKMYLEGKPACQKVCGAKRAHRKLQQQLTSGRISVNDCLKGLIAHFNIMASYDKEVAVDEGDKEEVNTVLEQMLSSQLPQNRRNILQQRACKLPPRNLLSDQRHRHLQRQCRRRQYRLSHLHQLCQCH